MTRYGDEHRLFLQIMLTRKILSLSEIKAVLEFCHEKNRVPCNATKDDDSLTRFVSDINGKIVPFSMRIKHGVSEDDGQRFYALVNLKDNDLSKCATMFSGNEMTYFKKLVQQIAESNTGTIQSTEALNIASGLDNCRLSIGMAEDLIERWLELGCLMQVRASVLKLPRGTNRCATHFSLYCQRNHRNDGLVSLLVVVESRWLKNINSG
ncbi:SMC protein, putative [Ixodes scapularis]|uniref:Non-structural maintenance of chromosomes element 1 homolog n=1 Tax=Ixodes scapularis TaxID=6945 RepID=B7QDY2_IXOSC|nr:SMC protein, putative [Ixodes scapularis]|eukprot:XP_002413746.1 SMC protein, putative [Ixodes scapularis]